MGRDLRDRPLPTITKAVSAADYHYVPFFRSHRLANEPLVRVEKYGLRTSPYYSRSDGLNFPYARKIHGALRRIYLRESVAKRLCHVNDLLRSYSVELCLLDGYRSVVLQKEIWDFYFSWAQRRHPNWSVVRLTRFVTQFASDPRCFDLNDPSTWPTHATGGAVDLTLAAKETGEFIFMGGIFDDPSTVSATRYFEQYHIERYSASETVALQYRRLLYHAMAHYGFQNYPAEWWHFDWGTQMWAHLSMIAGRNSVRRKAIFGYIEPPTE